MADDAGAVRRTQDDELIEQAARAIFLRQLRDRQPVTVTYQDWEVDAWRSEPADGQAEYRADARALAAAGLLADPEVPMVPAAELEDIRQHARNVSAQRDVEHAAFVDAVDERDMLALMLRAMARKLVAYRRWADGDVPTARRLTAVVAEAVHLLRTAGINDGDGLPARLQTLIAERDQMRRQVIVAEEREQAAERRETLRQDQRDQLQARIAELEASIGHHTTRLGERIGQLQARIDEIRAVLEEDAQIRARFQVDTSTSYGPRFLSRIRAIVERVPSGRAALQGDQPTEPKTPGGFPYRQHPHPLAGSNVERQQVGDPGHCEDCCSVGHVVAHPDVGCGDVGCYRTHNETQPTEEAGRG